MTEKLKLVCFNTEASKRIQLLNDIFNDLTVMIARGELDKESTSRFIEDLLYELDATIEKGRDYTFKKEMY